MKVDSGVEAQGAGDRNGNSFLGVGPGRGANRTNLPFLLPQDGKAPFAN